jgi:hypothetical protein
MALETQYIIANNEESNYPVIYRVIVLDGVEVNRGEPFFAEVASAYPPIIEEYFNAVASWAHALASYFDSQATFSADNFSEANKASRFFRDFEQKFDYVTFESGMPHLQAPDTVATEETPDTE